MAAGFFPPDRERLALPITAPKNDAQNDPALWAATTPAAGAPTNTQPLDGLPVQRSGARAASFFDDYYNRVHVIPGAVDFGNINGDQGSNVSLWNARLGPITLNSVSADKDHGIGLAGVNAPLTMKALATLPFSVVAAADGPASIDMHWTFRFSDGQQSVLPVVGTRSVTFALVPNWRDGYKVSYEFKTDIFTSRSGREQRRAQRSTPRKSVGFTITLPSATALNRFMAKSQAIALMIPDYSRHVEVLHGIPVGASTFDVIGDVPNWIAPGLTIAVENSQRIVESVDGNTVLLKSPLFVAMPEGAIVRPIVSGRLGEEVQVVNHTDTVVEAQIGVALAPGAVLPDDFASPQEVFNGREVFMFDPNWATPVQGQFLHPVDTVDFGRGRTQTFVPIQFDTRIRQVQFLFPTQADRAAAVALFSRMHGQRGEFYLPTWEEDLVVARPAAADTLTVWVSGKDVFDTFAESTTHRAIAILTASGDQFHRRITKMSTDGVDTLLETDIEWPVDMTSEVRLSWLLATRFGSDRLDMDCATDEVGQAQFVTRSLEDLPVGDADRIWSGLDEGAQWLIDRFGWNFTSRVLYGSIHEWVNVTYPSIAGTFRANDGGYYFRRTYGYPDGATHITTPLNRFVNIVYPRISNGV